MAITKNETLRYCQDIMIYGLVWNTMTFQIPQLYSAAIEGGELVVITLKDGDMGKQQ